MDDRDVLICDVSGHVCCDVVGGDELEEDAKGRSRQDKVRNGFLYFVPIFNF